VCFARRQTWQLLVAEHIAHTLLQNTNVPACTSRIYTFANRRFLEVNRFDRAGAEGRVGVSSLLSIDTSLYGRLDNWIDSAARLRNGGRITAETLEQVRLVATFGTLVANTDQHLEIWPFLIATTATFSLRQSMTCCRCSSPPSMTRSSSGFLSRPTRQRTRYMCGIALGSSPRVTGRQPKRTRGSQANFSQSPRPVYLLFTRLLKSELTNSLSAHALDRYNYCRRVFR
jgi:hypothetical protein